MSQNATPATQNDMTTCLETFEKESSWKFRGVTKVSPFSRQKISDPVKSLENEKTK